MSMDRSGHGAHGAPQATAEAASGGGSFTCPMHPEVRQDGPGSCPNCGMTLVVAGRRA